jgi:FMN phosphatase YigB (HAD superfamily)
MSDRPAAPLRAILFDAGNTLLRMNYDVIALELGRLGFAVSPDAVQRAEWTARVRLDAEVLSRGLASMSTESQLTASRYVRYLLDALGIGDPAAMDAMDRWRRTYNVPVGPWNVADPLASEALGLAARAGIATAVISNSNGSVRSILESLGLARHLDFVIDSFEVGIEKPDPRIFQLALDRLGVGSREAAYIGDIYSVDVLGARAVGLEAVLLDPGSCWGARDCLVAPDVLSAVRLVLERGR